MQGGDILHHMRRLSAQINGQALFTGVPVSQNRAGLQCDAGVTAKDELGFHNLIRILEGLIHRAGIQIALERQVAPQHRMNHRRIGIKRSAHIRHRDKLFVIHRHGFGGILGERPAGRDNRRHRLALPTGAINRDRVLRSRFETLEMGQDADPRRNHFRQFRAGDDRDDAGHRLCRGRIDIQDLGMRIGRAQEYRMRHARQHHVAHILPTPLQQPIKVWARYRLSDVRIRAVQNRKTGLLFGAAAHRACSERARAVASTASTIA